MEADAGKRKETLAGLAHAILHFEPPELRDLGLALALAERANDLCNTTDPDILGILAKVRAQMGDMEETNPSVPCWRMRRPAY
jgi:hypothetical protein